MTDLTGIVDGLLGSLGTIVAGGIAVLARRRDASRKAKEIASRSLGLVQSDIQSTLVAVQTAKPGTTPSLRCPNLDRELPSFADPIGAEVRESLFRLSREIAAAEARQLITQHDVEMLQACELAVQAELERIAS